MGAIPLMLAAILGGVAGFLWFWWMSGLWLALAGTWLGSSAAVLAVGALIAYANRRE